MTNKLSESQRTVLAAACRREDRCVFPVTAKLKGNAAGNVLKSLLGKGLIEEVAAEHDDTVWRHTDAGPLTLRATREGFSAVGEEPADDTADGAAVVPARAPDGRESGKRPPAARAAPLRPQKPKTLPTTIRAGTKQAQLVEMLKRPTGATVDEIVAVFGWQPHTVRGAIAGALKKKLGLKIDSEKVDGRGRIYRTTE